MKKLKVLLGAIALIAAMAFVSCGQPTGNNGLVSGGAEETTGVRTWTAASNDGVTITDNGDGTCSFTLSAQYNGNAVLLYINQDHSSIAAGKKAIVNLDYSTTSTINPKFYFCLAKDDTSSWDTVKTSDDKYVDATSASGSLTAEIEATSESNEFKVKFNAWEWAGSESDTINVTVKSVTVE